MTDKISYNCLALIFLFFLFAPSEALDVAVLKSADIKPYNEALEGFRSACDCRVREVILSESADAAARVRGIKPDMVLAIGMDALTKLLDLKDLPVVYTMVPHPQSLDSGNRNISGVSIYVPPDKYLSSILEVFPDAKRIGVIYDPGVTGPFVMEARQIFESKGVELVLKKTASPRDVTSLIDGMKDKIDAFWMLPDTTVINPEAVNYLFLFSFQNKVPVFTFSKKYLDMGAVASLTIEPYDLGVQTGEVVRKLVQENFRTPIRVSARKAVLTINRKIAQKLGIRLKGGAGGTGNGN